MAFLSRGIRKVVRVRDEDCPAPARPEPERADSERSARDLPVGEGPAGGASAAGVGKPGPARPLLRAGRPRAGSSPAAARAAGAPWRAPCRRWQRWPSAERPAMAGVPGPLRLALLLLGAVGRAGPRPQVRPAGPGAGLAAVRAAAGQASRT